MHVARVTRRYVDKSGQRREYSSVLVRRTYRAEGKVKHETLGNLSALPAETVRLVEGSLKGQRYLPAEAVAVVQRSLPHGHVAAVWTQAELPLGAWRVP